MSHLFIDLPSFATDYSGAASVLYNLSGLVVIHEPSGCMGNFTGFDEPRWYHEPKGIFSSFIRENEVILGDDSIIIEKILQEFREKAPKFIAICGTPVPDLIGCDLPGIACEIADITGLPAFALETNGFGNYQDGISMALSALEEQFMCEPLKTQFRTVNILGYSPLDFFLSDDLHVLKSIIHSFGFEVQCFIADDSLEVIALAPEAEKNIVISSAALPLAEKMLEKYSIPYYVGLPCAQCGREKLKAFLLNEEPKLSVSDGNNRKVLVIGEQVFSNAIRDFLKYQAGFSKVDIVTFFTFSQNYADPNDLKLNDEGQLKNLIINGCYDVIIGDPLFSKFVDSGQKFIPLPHPAVSSRLYWNSYVSVIDNRFSRRMEEWLKD